MNGPPHLLLVAICIAIGIIGVALIIATDKIINRKR